MRCGAVGLASVVHRKGYRVAGWEQGVDGSGGREGEKRGKEREGGREGETG